MCCNRHDDGRDPSQLPDDFMRFVEPSHLCVTRREEAIARHPALLHLQRAKQLKSSGKKVADTDPHQSRWRRLARIEEQPVSKCLTARSGCPAHNLIQPLQRQPSAELGLSSSERSIKAMAASRSSPK